MDGIKRNNVSLMFRRESCWYIPIAAIDKIMTKVKVPASGNKDEKVKGSGSTLIKKTNTRAEINCKHQHEKLRADQ